MVERKKERNLYITRQNFQYLWDILNGYHAASDQERANINRLKEGLDWANVVNVEDLPVDVVSMNSIVCLHDVDSGEEMKFTLVFPSRADYSENRVSVLAPVGSAVLGCRTGEVIEWEVPAGIKRLKIEEILYQPEAAGMSSK
jgi:regulator of nucleoside diphosphate kinase